MDTIEMNAPEVTDYPLFGYPNGEPDSETADRVDSAPVPSCASGVTCPLASVTWTPRR